MEMPRLLSLGKRCSGEANVVLVNITTLNILLLSFGSEANVVLVNQTLFW